MVAKLKSRTSRALHLTDIRKKLLLTQEALAGKIDVKPGTIAAWESAAKATDYWPSTEILARLAAFIAKRGKRFDGDCIWLLKEAGTLSADILRVLDNQRNRRTKPRPSEPGEIVSLPLMDAASGYSPAASFVQTVELPASLLRERGSLVCVHIEQAELIKSFPFAPGGLLVLDQSETDLELLLRRPSSIPVAVHYSRLRNSQERGPINREQSITYADLRRSAEAVARLRELEGLDEAGTNSKELWTKYGPYEKDPKKKWDAAGIHVGWLVLEYAGGEGEGPWRIVSRGASVGGLCTGRSLALTEWDQGPGPFGVHCRLSDLMVEDQRILGRVVLWLPEWSPAAEGAQPAAKSRKEPK